MSGVELHFERKLSRLSKHLRNRLVNGLKMVEPALKQRILSSINKRKLLFKYSLKGKTGA